MGKAVVEPTPLFRESFTLVACASPARTGTLMAREADTHLVKIENDLVRRRAAYQPAAASA